MKERWLRIATITIGLLSLSLASCAVAHTMGNGPIEQMTPLPLTTPLPTVAPTSESSFLPAKAFPSPIPDPYKFCYDVQAHEGVEAVLKRNKIDIDSPSTIDQKVVVLKKDGTCPWAKTVSALSENPTTYADGHVCYFNGNDAAEMVRILCNVLR